MLSPRGIFNDGELFVRDRGSIISYSYLHKSIPNDISAWTIVDSCPVRDVLRLRCDGDLTVCACVNEYLISGNRQIVVYVGIRYRCI